MAKTPWASRPLYRSDHLRVRLRMSGMADSSDEQAAHGEVDHGLGDIEAAFVIADEATISGQPAEAALDHPAARQDFETRLCVEAPDNLDDEVEISRLVEKLAPVVGASGKEVVDTGPALADRIQDRLVAGAVGGIGGRQVDHQEPSIGVHRDVPLAPDDLLAGVVAPLGGHRRLDRLAVDDAGARTG